MWARRAPSRWFTSASVKNNIIPFATLGGLRASSGCHLMAKLSTPASFYLGLIYLNVQHQFGCLQTKNGPCLTVELFWSLLNTTPYFFLYLCTSVLTSVDLSLVNQEFSSLILIKSDTRTGGFSGLILVLHPSIHVWYLHYSPKTDEQGEYLLPVWHEKKEGKQLSQSTKY